ncbi:MAG: class I SAM-dependent methyltransferase [candidate division Zixibacteria bacterium]|nr:class I SAM-dependent methyltransferase [candidate division Zixibacteria bacterium]
MDERIQEEIESFDDVAAYDELMARPYTRYLKKNVDDYISQIKLKDAVILELGCGVSEHAYRFKDDNLVILTDITDALLLKNDPDCARAAADAQVLPFKSNSCDFVIYLGILHHLPDQYASLAETARVLKPGGRVFIQEPHRMSLNFFYYYGRRFFMKLVGVENVKKMIGCFSPDEWQLDKKALKKVFANDSYDWKKWTILSFRMPPFRLFKNSSLDVVLSKILDKLPVIRNVGTTIFYEIIKRKSDETV